MHSLCARLAAALGLAALGLAGCADQPVGSFDRPRYVADAAQAQTDLRFIPGSAQLASGEAERLAGFLRSLVLRQNDDIVLTFGPSGSTTLDRARIAAAEAAVARAGAPARVRTVDHRGFGRGVDRGDRVLVQAVRYDVLVVECGDAGIDAADAGLLPPMGCANAANLAHMAASVRDLTEPRVLGPTPAATLARAPAGAAVPYAPTAAAAPSAPSPSR